MADTVATLQAVITAETAGFEKGLASTKKGLGGFGAAAGAAMGLATKAIDLAIGAVEGLGNATIGAAIKFDKSLKNIQAVTGQTSDEIKALGGELMSIGARSVAGTQDVTDAYYEVASGITLASARMATLKAAVALSEAGNASLAASTSALISIMNSYAYSADKAGFASDVLTQTVGVGVGSMESFASALGPISGLAAKVGVKFEELGASAAYLTTKGASASQAATRLQATMTAMLNPNAQMTQALRKAGYASGEAAIKQLGLVGAINALYKASGGSADKMAKMAGSVEALQAMVALAGPEFAGFAEDFANGLDGATAAAQKVQLGSFDAQWKMFTNTLSAAAQAVGMLVLPALNGIISFINGAMGTVGKFAPLITEGIGKIAGIFKPLLDEINRVTAPITTAISNIKTAFDTFFNSLFADTTISAAGQRLSKKLGETLTPDKTLQEKIGPAFATLKDTIAAELGKIDLIGIATGLINAAASFGETLARNILLGLLDLGSRVIAQLGAQFKGVDILKEAGKLIDSALTFGGKLIDNLLSGLTDIVTKVGDEVGKIDTVDIGAKAGKFLADALAFGAKLIGKLVSGLLGLDTQVGTEVGAQLDRVDILTRAGNLLGKVLEVGGKLIGKFNEAIASLGASFGAEIKKNLESIDILAAIQKLLTAAATNAQTLVNQFISGIGALGHDFGFKIADNLKSIDVGAAAKELLTGAGKVATDFIGGAVNGLADLGKKLIDAITTELGKIPGGVADFAKGIGKAIGDAIAGGTTGGAPMSEGAATVLKNEAARGQGSRAAAGGTTDKIPTTLPKAFDEQLATGKQKRMVSGGTTGGAGAGSSMDGQNAAFDYIEGFQAIMERDGYKIGDAISAAFSGITVDASALTAKFSEMFSGVDITNTLTNLSTTISSAIATTFGADGAVMTALQPFADSWSQMFGAGGTIAAAATGMQSVIDMLVGSIVSINGTGTPAIIDFEAVSTSAAPTIAGSWQPVVGVFKELLMTLEGIAGAAQRATSAMGAVPGVGGGVSGARAGGGAVARGQTYLVGENGPELFTAKSNGQIIPNGGTASVGGGGGGITITGPINVYGATSASQMYDQIRKEAQRRNA